MKTILKKLFKRKPLNNLEKIAGIKKNIRNDYVKEFGTEKNSVDKVKYNLSLFYKIEEEFFQKSLLLMEELDITYYLNKDSIGASFYILRRYGKVIYMTKPAFLLDSCNEDLYLRLLEMKGNIIK